MVKHEIELGQKVKDSVTGFRGVATARCEYLYEAPVILVESQMLVDGKPIEPLWFPEDRLDLVLDNKPS